MEKHKHDQGSGNNQVRMRKFWPVRSEGQVKKRIGAGEESQNFIFLWPSWKTSEQG